MANTTSGLSKTVLLAFAIALVASVGVPWATENANQDNEQQIGLPEERG